MAFISAQINIPGMARTSRVRLYFPTDLPEAVGNKVQGVITLLHGLGNSPDDWMMMSAAPRYAADNGYILVVPEADNSFYTDMRHGAAYYTLLTEELPAQLGAIFKIPTEREKNFIAGLSMGGYGALHIGLTHPERYAAIGSFSGVVDIASILEGVKATGIQRGPFEGIYGEALEFPAQDSIAEALAKTAKLPPAQQPRIFTTSGRKDTQPVNILEMNRQLAANAATLPLDFVYREWDGVHEWNFWDRSLAEFIGFIQNDGYGARKQADWSAV